jgi:hypothetical protein
MRFKRQEPREEIYKKPDYTGALFPLSPGALKPQFERSPMGEIAEVYRSIPDPRIETETATVNTYDNTAGEG